MPVPINYMVSEKERFREQAGRPLVTLSYAQSLDGCIALCRGKFCALSGSASQVLTHRLRAAHDSLLVGIGTVLSDNPRLTVRLAKGKDPIPIVLDSRLRFPLNSNLLKNHIHPLIATTFSACPDRQKALEESGARVIRVPPDERGWVDLKSLLAILARLEISSLMVEGGARVISSFLSLNLVDRIVITITPKLLGGLHAIENPLVPEDPELYNHNILSGIKDFGYEQLGNDIVFWSALSNDIDR